MRMSQSLARACESSGTDEIRNWKVTRVAAMFHRRATSKNHHQSRYTRASGNRTRYGFRYPLRQPVTVGGIHLRSRRISTACTHAGHAVITIPGSCRYFISLCGRVLYLLNCRWLRPLQPAAAFRERQFQRFQPDSGLASHQVRLSFQFSFRPSTIMKIAGSTNRVNAVDATRPPSMLTAKGTMNSKSPLRS